MRSYLDRGDSVVKKKIGGASLAEDRGRIEAVLRLLGPGQRLAVDATGRFDLKTAVEYAGALSDYDLFWYAAGVGSSLAFCQSPRQAIS